MGLQCGICFEPYNEPVSIPCGHVFCSGCLAKTFEEYQLQDTYEIPCPSCRAPFPILQLDTALIPRKLRPHCTPCIRRIYLDDTEATDRATIRSLEAQLRAEKARNVELQEEKDAMAKERESLYRLVELYKSREKEMETKDLRQKFRVANRVDELTHDNQRLQARLEEAQTLLATMGIERRTPPASTSTQPAPSTPKSSSSISSRPTIFATPSTPRTLTFTPAPISPLKGGLAVAREDLQARLRVSSTPSPSKSRLGDKRQRDLQDDIDMAGSEEADNSDDTITLGNSRRPARATGVLGRSVRRKYGLD